MKLIIFDCDSTLSSIEGIDELARLAGEATFAKVEALTNAAMNGETPLDTVFAQRLSIISPTKAQAEEIGQLYIKTVEPSAVETLDFLRKAGWTPLILSGGFKVLIEPLADFLNIERVEAVPLHFDKNQEYAGFDASYPTTYNGGKPEIIEQLKRELNPEKIIMVGDGVSDLETKNVVDAFVGFGAYTVREKVQKEADYFIFTLDELKSLLKE